VGGSCLRSVLVVVLLVLSVLLLLPPTPRAQVGGAPVLYIAPLRTRPTNSSFSVDLRLNLTTTDTISNWEISLNYSSQVLTATGITLGNLFPVSSVFEPIHCVNGVGSGCGAFDGPGVVHSAVLFRGGNVSGSFYNRTLFSIQFSPTGNPYGSSLLHIFNDSLGSPGRSYISPYPILHLSEDGIFANHGVAAFFNVIGPAVLLVHQPVYFDASGSLSVNGASITKYSWSFGDGSSGLGVNPVHTYNVTREYVVVLNVTSSDGIVGSIRKTVNIVSALGGLVLLVKDLAGNNIPYDVSVVLLNSSVVVVRETKSSSVSRLNFSNLAPGTYSVDFSGSSVVSYSKQETVTPGWTTNDTVYLTVVPPSNPPDLRLFIVLAAVGAGLAIGMVGLFRRRRAMRMGKARPLPRAQKTSKSR
jgi:PKD domain